MGGCWRQEVCASSAACGGLNVGLKADKETPLIQPIQRFRLHQHTEFNGNISI